MAEPIVADDMQEAQGWGDDDDELGDGGNILFFLVVQYNN